MFPEHASVKRAGNPVLPELDSGTMRLYLLRHADALEGANDAGRPLSPKGKKQARAVGLFLKKAGIQFDVACSSPLVRARQSAEIVLATCAPRSKTKVTIAEALLNETSDFEFACWLKGLPEVGHLLLVGHAPTLAQRLGALLRAPNAEVVRLPKGGLACLETEDRREVILKFFITPRVLGL